MSISVADACGAQSTAGQLPAKLQEPRRRSCWHDVDEISALLGSSDVFVTPYGDAAQIVSGALSYAVATGLPFVSTPYRYAVGLAASGCGETTDFGDHEAMTRALNRMLIDETQRHRMAGRARVVAAVRSWPQIGVQLSGLLDAVVDERWPSAVAATRRSAPFERSHRRPSAAAVTS